MHQHLNYIKLLLRVSRPHLWWAPTLVFLIGATVADAPYSNTLIFHAALFTLLGNVFAYGINDVYDYTTDHTNTRKDDEHTRSVEQHKTTILTACYTAAALLTTYAILATSPTTVIGTAIFLTAAYTYSAWPRFKNRPPLDAFTNMGLYLGAILMGYGYNGTLASLPPIMYLVGLGIVAIHAYSTIPDYTADRRANEQTFATIYGKRATAGFATALFALIWIAGSFQSPELRVGLALGTGTFATSTITTDECLAYHLIRTLGAASCIIMTIFIITH